MGAFLGCRRITPLNQDREPGFDCWGVADTVRAKIFLPVKRLTLAGRPGVQSTCENASATASSATCAVPPAGPVGEEDLMAKMHRSVRWLV
jgi:hypothetical protein